MKCIWCKKNHSIPSKEHIIPEALGCPNGFLLSNGEVCLKCNNGLAHLDQAVIHDFDFLKFMKGIPRKKGKSPEISTRGNVVGYHKQNEKIIFFNNDRKEKISFDGRLVSPIGKSKRNVYADVSQKGKVSFQSTLGENPKFARGILKIAFSSAVYFLKPDQFLKSEYDPIRNFVVNGQGERKIILFPAEDQNYRNEVTPLGSDSLKELMIFLRLGHLNFLVDVTPEMSVFPKLRREAEALYGKKGWAYLPV